MKKPAVPIDEELRLAALYELQLLDTPAEERFDRITRLASRALDAPMALVSLVDRHRQWFKSGHGFDAVELDRGESFCGHAINGDEVFVVPDAAGDDRFHDNPLVVGHHAIRFYAGQPIHASNGQRVGMLCVLDGRPREFSDDDVRTLKDLATLVETEMQRNLLSATHSLLVSERDALQREAMIDDLTRLWNRRAIVDLLERERSRTRRGEHMSVAMLDIDHFKFVNDTFGHPAGDVVLQVVAARVRNSVRDFDSIGRYGGEEFLVVLDNCDAAHARAIAERIRATVAGSPIGAKGIGVTVSIGLSTCTASSAPDQPLLDEADQALYRAKKRGRNRVESFA